MSIEPTVVPAQADYYGHHFWNSYAAGIAEINRRISGEPDVPWFAHFSRRTKPRRFRKALILNCGNGWVERELLDKCDLFAEAVGIDYTSELLDQARAAAGTRPLRYHQVDVNAGAFPEDGFDLVVNLAACHHIAYLDRVLRAVCTLLSDDGVFLNNDYVGPHRNQYPYDDWAAAWTLNRTLPAALRSSMPYPHLPTMLATDPTEAVHSELIVQTVARYFHFEEHRHVGGTLAYPLLVDNHGLWNATDDDKRRWVAHVMAADGQHLAAHPERSYFDYFVCRPNKAALEDRAALARWADEEVERERRAAANGGRYYDPTCLQALQEELADARLAAEHRLATIGELHRQIDALSTPLERVWRRSKRWLGRVARGTAERPA